MKLLEDTPAVLSLGKLCDEHGYSYEWINGQKPHLIKDGIRIQCNTENFVPIVVPGLSTTPSSSSTSTSVTPSGQEIDHSDHHPAIKSSRNGCKNSERILWMKEFLKAETHTQVLLMRSADLGKHGVYTHFPKDRNCEICQRTKITRAPCRRRIGRVVPRAENFGDLITADHNIVSEGCESRNNHRYAVVVQDLATQWIQAYPCKTKTSQETQRSLQNFLKPIAKPKVITLVYFLGIRQSL